METILATVKAYIMEQFLPNANPDDLTADTPLIEGGILDSLATVRLAAYLEEQYGVQLQPYDVNEDNLGSLEKIVALVRRSQPPPAGPTSEIR